MRTSVEATAAVHGPSAQDRGVTVCSRSSRFSRQGRRRSRHRSLSSPSRPSRNLRIKYEVSTANRQILVRSRNVGIENHRISSIVITTYGLNIRSAFRVLTLRFRFHSTRRARSQCFHFLILSLQRRVTTVQYRFDRLVPFFGFRRPANVNRFKGYEGRLQITTTQ